MDAAHALLMNDRNSEITAAVLRERAKLWSFIRRRVPDPSEAEDILQDVFYDFVRAYRLPEPIEQAAAWLFHVARNRIIDRFRKKRSLPATEVASSSDIEESDYWLDLALPPIDTGPEAMYARSAVLVAMQQALDELPTEQREIFVAHELDGQSFKDIAARSGVAVNTLLARKRYAVLSLRARLHTVFAEWDL
jgi:RNA polymerase sigma factor (sigma-70 family)